MKGWNNIMAAATSLILFIVLVGTLMTMLSAEVISLTDQWSVFSDRLLSLYSEIILFINENLPALEEIDEDEVIENAKEWLKGSWSELLGRTFSESTSFLTSLFSVFLFSFLFLLYRPQLVQAFIKFAPKGQEKNFLNMLKEIQQVGQKYLIGMLTLITILGLLNSVGLWIIGVETPFLFGYMAALLSIIPYIGTAIGALIPIIYTLMAYDALWMPVSVAILFWSIQILEGNFLNPKIVGKSVNVNAFAAILSLFLGATIWGVAGMILFLPFTAMFKVICRHYHSLEPLGDMIDDQTADNDEEKNNKWFWEKWF
jgi:predicted PurR-regulated permease PerM